jgi:hypothetical protein
MKGQRYKGPLILNDHEGPTIQGPTNIKWSWRANDTRAHWYKLNDHVVDINITYTRELWNNIFLKLGNEYEKMIGIQMKHQKE